MQTFDSNLSDSSAERIPWYNVWIDVTTSPSRATFRHILADPTSSPVRAYMWIGIVTLLVTMAQLVITQAVGGPTSAAYLPGMQAWTLLCMGIAAPVMGIIGFIIGTGITHFIAGLFGGSGKFDDLAYCMGAIQAPLGIFSGLISILITVLGSFSTSGLAGLLIIVPALISIAMGIYAMVLQVMAVGEAEYLTTGKATLVVLLPVIVSMALGICIFAFAVANGINQLN